MAISKIAAYIYDSNKVLQKQGSLTWEDELGLTFTFEEVETNIEKGEIGSTRLAFVVPLGTFSGGTPLVTYRRKDGYLASLLTMSTANWTIMEGEVTTTYQVLYVDLTVVGWTLKAGRQSVQANYLMPDGDFQPLPLVFYTVQDGINDYGEITADEYQEISTSLHDQYADLLDRLSTIETYSQNAFNYNGIIENGVDYIQWLTTPRTEQGDLPISARRWNDEFKTTELRLSSSVVLQDG
ncbi:hypothetical protein, partial [Methanoculleus sp.]|uniref:hypothetical protein n=1 Tax=Methanoculleus sp. TaxID=90427 RepID=UPI0025D0CA94